MRRRSIATLLLLLCVLGFTASGRAGEASATLGLTITILPGCITAVDEDPRNVSERCNFARPYRIITTDTRNVPQAVSFRQVGCAPVAGEGSHAQGRAGCDTSRSDITTIIYY